VTGRIEVYVEIAPKKTFACALDWPGWARSGKDESLALAALADYAARYRPVVREAGLEFPPEVDVGDLDVVDRLDGSAGTDFGVPSHVASVDGRPVDETMAARFAGIVGAAWATFDRVAAAAPTELRKGPRGGGRDTPKVIAHVIESDQAYAREIGIRRKAFPPDDRTAVDDVRQQVLAVLRQPNDGSPLGGRRWPSRYAARRIAWHALDHAWEIEDRSEPAG
jgi:hypothetical protein